jgi:8-oxo-dGTP pyrophosphatase MutT (NUDIX family)
MAALSSADGAFLLGEMASHIVNAGKIYFPSGTPDLSDVFDGRIDLEASAKRELFEETGVAAAETAVRPGWTVVLAERRIACMKPITLPLSAEAVRARIDAFLARDPNSELRRMHIVRRRNDIDRERTPDFVVAYLEAAFDQVSLCDGSEGPPRAPAACETRNLR